MTAAFGSKEQAYHRLFKPPPPLPSPNLGEGRPISSLAVFYDNLSFGNSTQPPPFSLIGGKEGIGGEQDRLAPRVASRTVKPAVSAASPLAPRTDGNGNSRFLAFGSK